MFHLSMFCNVMKFILMWQATVLNEFWNCLSSTSSFIEHKIRFPLSRYYWDWPFLLLSTLPWTALRYFTTSKKLVVTFISLSFKELVPLYYLVVTSFMCHCLYSFIVLSSYYLIKKYSILIRKFLLFFFYYMFLKVFF